MKVKKKGRRSTARGSERAAEKPKLELKPPGHLLRKPTGSTSGEGGKKHEGRRRVRRGRREKKVSEGARHSRFLNHLKKKKSIAKGEAEASVGGRKRL